MSVRELESLYKDITIDSVNDFIGAIRSVYINKGISTLMLQGFLGRLMDQFLPEGENICRANCPLSEKDEQTLIIHGKILAAFILILTEARAYNEAGKKILQFLEYAACCTRGRNDLIVPAIRCLSNNCIEVLYTWDNILKSENLELLTYQIANTSRFSTEAFPSLQFQGKGCLSLANGILSVSSSYAGLSGAKAFDICDGRVCILTRNSRDEKIKASDVGDISKLDEFARVFRLTQSDEEKTSCGIRFQEVKAGHKAIIECTEIEERDDYDVLIASAVNTKDECKGEIISEELIKGTYTEDLFDYVRDNDCINGAVAEMVDGSLCFSIKDSYARFAKKTAEKDYRDSKVFEAKVLDIREDIERMNWMTARGYGAISRVIDGLKVGDKAVMCVQNVHTRGSDIYINIQQPRDGYDSIDYLFDDDSVLSEFFINKKTALELTNGPSPSGQANSTSGETFGRLAYIMSHNHAHINPSERYKHLMTAGFMFDSIGDASGLAFVQKECSYLSQILRFAQKLPIFVPSDLEVGDTRRTILECLSTFGYPDKIATTASFISQYPGTLCSHIAELIIASDASDEFEDEIKASTDDVRLRICTLLGVQDIFTAEGVTRTGKYGRGEGQTLEFKSSYVMRNDGRGADLDYQGRGQVFEAVCAFLNGDGGTVYIGVNDKTGDPIISEEYGIKGDMKWLCNNYGAVNSIRSRQLGHNIIKPDTIDHYALFLCSEKELFFKKSLHNNIIIEPTEDEDAIRITVRPSLYEIAYLYKDNTFTDGQAFTRNGNRTVRMSKSAMERRLMNLKQLSKEVQFIVAINEAIDRKHKLIFRGYHSGNSGEIRDRYVVPINLFYNDENVLCYDLDAKAERQFRLSRITSIDSDVPDAYYPHCFEPKTADVFRWISEENYHIRICMEVGALNYLLEEYSDAKNLSEQELYRTEDGKWILDTVLHGLGGICRFYLGLADKITILPSEDSEKLKNYIRTFVKSTDINTL